MVWSSGFNALFFFGMRFIILKCGREKPRYTRHSLVICWSFFVTHWFSCVHFDSLDFLRLHCSRGNHHNLIGIMAALDACCKWFYPASGPFQFWRVLLATSRLNRLVYFERRRLEGFLSGHDKHAIVTNWRQEPGSERHPTIEDVHALNFNNGLAPPAVPETETRCKWPFRLPATLK